MKLAYIFDQTLVLYKEASTSPSIDPVVYCLFGGSFLDTLDCPFWSYRNKEFLCTSVRKLAEKNRFYQSYLKYNNVLLAERYQLLGKLITTVKHKKKELNKLNGKLSLKATHQLLKEKVAHFKDVSEGLGQNFVEGRMFLIDFVESFQNFQKSYYTHLVQLEKMQNFHMETNETGERKNFFQITIWYNQYILQHLCIMLTNAILFY